MEDVLASIGSEMAAVTDWSEVMSLEETMARTGVEGAEDHRVPSGEEGVHLKTWPWRSICGYRMMVCAFTLVYCHSPNMCSDGYGPATLWGAFYEHPLSQPWDCGSA